MQGYPLAIVAHGIVILALIKHLKSAYPNATQPRYTDDSGALVMFDNLEQYFNLFKCNGLDQGY